MTEHGPDTIPLRARVVGAIYPCEDSTVIVAHLFEPEGSSGECDNDGCGNDAHDPGLVDLTVLHGEDGVAVQMFPGEALELANRLERAANLVLESAEDVPDVEREAARFAPHRECSDE